MIEINNRSNSLLDEKLVEEVCKKFLKIKKIKKDLSVAFIGDAKMRQLNKIYRQKDKTTDILSFSGDEENFGEIIICLSEIKKQAKRIGKTYEEELVFILIHGLLHLIGYDDEDEKGRLEMIKKGQDFIDKYL